MVSLKEERGSESADLLKREKIGITYNDGNVWSVKGELFNLNSTDAEYLIL
jgi:hypothetical protein